jgi:hypothetical protein
LKCEISHALYIRLYLDWCYPALPYAEGAVMNRLRYRNLVRKPMGVLDMTSTAWLKFVSGCGILVVAGCRPLDFQLQRK